MSTLALLAQNQTPPAGGGATGQVIIGTVGAAIVTAAVFGLVLAHRSGRTKVLNRAAALAERQTGLPGWCAVPLTVLSTSLIVAVFGMYWDIATHIDAGRDEGPFANASHYFILVGLFGIFAAGLIAVFMPTERPSRSAVRVPAGWYAPLGGVLITLCAIISLSAFPLDDLWHRIFGQDVTLYGPTHLVLFGGAALSVVGGLVLLTEGLRTGPPADRGAGTRKLLMAGFAGAFLIALSTFQGEYDYAVPQFRLVLHPVLLMIAASIALVTARVYVGRGGALAAALFFILVRGALSLLVTPTFGHTGLHFPLYLVEAAVVELVALRMDPRRTVAFGLIAGAPIGTVGLAAEWAWSYVWWTIEWPSSLLPEAAIAGLVAAVAGALLGALSATASYRTVRRRGPRLAGAAAAAGADRRPGLRGAGDRGRRHPRQRRADERRPRAEPDVHATARGPAGRGGRRALVRHHRLAGRGRVAPSSTRSRRSARASGAPRSRCRSTGRGRPRCASNRAVPCRECPSSSQRTRPSRSKAIPAEQSFTREFVRDKELLQREQKPDVSPALTTAAYLIVLLIALLLLTALTAGVMRLARTQAGTPAGATK